MTKLTTFAKEKLNDASMTICLFDRVENTVEKEKVLVTTVFLKAFYLGSLKVGDLW